MGIDKIGSVNNYNDYSKISKTGRINKTGVTDSVNISSEALNMAENKRVMDIVNKAPDVRADKVAKIKEKLKDPNYLNNTVLNGTADSILDIFFKI